MRSIGRLRLPAVNYWQAEIRTGNNPRNPKGMDLMGKTTDIREAVQAELDFDPLVDTVNITVKNIDGDVALNGTVPSYPQYQEAAAAARRVSGVRQVHNHLMVQLPDADYRDDVQLATA